ncbi:MAG: trimethylamine methyltransferase family protein [Alphaproteobacteria bacterium]|nr:trimethylamine methyltransferase family protein [Alphaproteobacteria bacterium]
MRETGRSERHKRAGRDRSARAARAAAAPKAFKQPYNSYPFAEVLSADQVEDIHNASLTILARQGIRMLNAEARRVLKDAGCRVDEGTLTVFFDPDFVMEKVALAPSEFVIHGATAERDVRIGGRWLAPVPVGGPPNVSDFDEGRRPGNWRDCVGFIEMSQTADVIMINTPSVEPIDLPVATRHLDVTRAQLVLTEKPPFVYARGDEPLADGLEMTRIMRGLSQEAFEARPHIYTVVNTNSPLQIDNPMGQGIVDMARAGQVTIVTPFTLAGAMAPVTIAGALTLQNAEALAGIVLAQCAKPGAPVIYGGFTSNVDMKSGAPAFGTPEYAKAQIASGQLCRRYGMPFRSSNVNASNAVDAQAAWESMMSLWSTITGGVNWLQHGAGWLEGGLVASYEKFAMDIDLLKMMIAFLEPMKTDPDSLAVEAIAQVGPGGHFFGSPHTMERYAEAFHTPHLADWRNFESWREDGAQTATDRAYRRSKEIRAAYRAPEVDAARVEELDAFIDKRKEAGGATLM